MLAKKAGQKPNLFMMKGNAKNSGKVGSTKYMVKPTWRAILSSLAPSKYIQRRMRKVVVGSAAISTPHLSDSFAT